MLKVNLDNGMSLQLESEMVQEIVKGFLIENTTFVEEDTEITIELDGSSKESKPTIKKTRKPYKRRTPKDDPVKSTSPVVEETPEKETTTASEEIAPKQRDLLQEAIDETPEETEVSEDAIVEEAVAEILAKEEQKEEAKAEPEVLDLSGSIFG